ncbi:MAG: hypothetical protein D6814_01325 [Calditrichaeota bacterium]|nr:MAG: hypothetical protein D6814_01325 [Calditrichota bacterium]
MDAGDVVCTAILQKDIEKGLEYALASLPYTFDRMKYGRKTTEAYLKRMENITMGKCAEAAIIRFLRAHGVRHSSTTGVTPFTEPDYFDLRIGDEIVDIKTFRLPEKYASAKWIINALALIPNQSPKDQWSQRHHYHRYVFGFFAGKLSLTLRQELSALLHKSDRVGKNEVRVSQQEARIFLTAAPNIAECEQKFRRIPAGSKCLQYPRGTRIENMGCWIRELTAFRKVVEWGGV